MSHGTTHDERFALSGINGSTGLPLVPERSWSELRARISSGGSSRPRAPSRWGGSAAGFRDALSRWLPAKITLGVPDGIDAEDPRQAGWAVVVATNAPQEARAAAERLLEHRRRVTGVPDDRSRLLEYYPGCPLRDWLRMNRFHIADVEPNRLPYYVLLVGDPGAITFEAQSLLDVHYAVGRLSFDDPQAYGRYVDSLIAYETAATVTMAREVIYWGPRHFEDAATELSADMLLRPLHEGLVATENDPEQSPVAEQRGFRSSGLIGAAATRASLAESVNRRRPALLFTASHGLGWPRGHAHQKTDQGALVGQEWPGPGVPPEVGHAFSAEGVEANANLHGMIAFLFACYSAGTPNADPVFRDESGQPVAVAEYDFVAALPQRLMSVEGGGALAVIGHVDRAWGCSIKTEHLGARIQPFRNFLSKILRGVPVGHTTQDFSHRYSGAALLGGGVQPPMEDDFDARRLWLEQVDARNHILLGDPAYRLRVDAIR